MRHLLSSLFITVLLLGSVGVASAFEADGYTTPDNWSMQTTPGQFKQSMTGVGLTKDSRLYMTLTTRLRLKSDEYADDQDIYQYLRMHTDSVKLGSGTVKAAAFGRFAKDLDGTSGKDWTKNYFYSQRDILDTEEEMSDFSPRLYHGYVQFDGVVKNTQANLGRFYLEHLNSFQLDGADATVKVADMLSIYAYGGRPVSYYYDLDGDSVYGAGAVLNYKGKTKLEGEYSRIDVQDLEDDYYRVRFTQMIPNGYVMVGYTDLNDAGTVNVDFDYEFAKTGTIITLGYEGMNDTVDSEKTYVVNPLTYTLLPESKYNKYKASVYQAFAKHFAAGVSYETKSVDGSENFDNRDYDKYGVKFDINGLPHPDTYISFTADKWDVNSASGNDDDNRMAYGFQIGQKVSEKVDVWAGSSFGRYEYDYATDKRKDSVRSYYIGGQYQPTKVLSFMADVSREDTDFYDDVDSSLSKNYMVELWASVAF